MENIKVSWSRWWKSSRLGLITQVEYQSHPTDVRFDKSGEPEGHEIRVTIFSSKNLLYDDVSYLDEKDVLSWWERIS